MGRIAAGALLIAATLLASRRWEAVDLYRFPLCWIGALLVLDGIGRARFGRSALPDVGAWVYASAGSLAFWDLFELINLRLRNWWYVGVSPDLIESSAFAAVSFATVLPALRLAEGALGSIPRSMPGPRRSPLPPALLGLLALALALAFPRVAFPLAWLFLWPLAEALLRAFPPAPGAAESPLESWLRGDRARIWRLMGIGLFLGLIWESLNWGCARGWVYTVPHFESPKLFEMPLPGYLGYLPFALEGAAMLALLDRLRARWSRAAGLAALAALLAAHVALEATAFPRSTLSWKRAAGQDLR